VCKDRVTLASTLLKIFRHEREEIFLLKAMNSLEIEKQGEVKVLIGHICIPGIGLELACNRG